MSFPKKAVWTASIVALLLSLLFFSAAVKAPLSENLSPTSDPTIVNGGINENTVWAANNSPYVVSSNIIVDANATLTIEAGAVVKFAGPYYLMVKGRLNATGTQLAQITFTSNASSPSPGSWTGLQSSGSNSTVTLRYAKIEYADTGVYGNNGNVTVSNSEISFSNVGIYYFQDSSVNAQGEIVDNVIRSNDIGVQIDIYYDSVGRLYFEDNAVTSNNGGVKLSFFDEQSFNVSIARNVISLNNATGITVDGGGTPDISLVNITQNYVTFNKQEGIFLNLMSKASVNVFSIKDNDIHDNGPYDFRIGGQHLSNVDYTYNASLNYWDTVSTDSIDEKIYDFYDDHRLGKVSYTPLEGSPLEKRYPDSAIDRVEPAISIPPHLKNNTYTGSLNVSVSWNGYDGGSGVEGYAVKLDYGQETSLGMVKNYTFTGLSEGIHSIHVFAFDYAGNTGETAISIGVDLTPPVISDLSVKNGSVIRSKLNLTWNGSDTVSGIDHYEVKLDGYEWVNVGGQTNYTITYLPDGTHTIDVRAFDKALNSKTATVTLVVNTSLLFGPGWVDDIAFFAALGTAIVAIAYACVFLFRKKKAQASEGTSASSPEVH